MQVWVPKLPSLPKRALRWAAYWFYGTQLLVLWLPGQPKRAKCLAAQQIRRLQVWLPSLLRLLSFCALTVLTILSLPDQVCDAVAVLLHCFLRLLRLALSLLVLDIRAAIVLAV